MTKYATVLIVLYVNFLGVASAAPFEFAEKIFEISPKDEKNSFFS